MNPVLSGWCLHREVRFFPAQPAFSNRRVHIPQSAGSLIPLMCGAMCGQMDPAELLSVSAMGPMQQSLPTRLR